MRKVLGRVNRAQDWLEQAERDFALAKLARREGHHEWACFVAQQAAEKAAKALHLFYGQEAWGHAVAKLLEKLPMETPSELIERARFLDAYYVPTRYPDAFPEGIPAEHYGPLQSKEALNHAHAILEFVRAQMAERG